MIFTIDGVTFGDTPPYGPLIVTTFDAGSPDITTDDVQRPLGDGLYLGRDLHGGRTWAWDLVTNQENITASLAALAALTRVWSSHRAPGDTVELRYWVAGRWRIVYGRPRRHAPTVGDAPSLQGVSKASIDFLVTDPRTYDVTLRSQSIGLVAASTGGLVEPLVAPLVSTRSESTQSRFVTVGGDAPTPLAVTFFGPLTDPRVVIDGQEVGITGEVAEDLPVTVDSRGQTVVRADGVPVPGRMSRRSRLDALLVSPGAHEVSFAGVTATGTGHVEIVWRDAMWGL